MSIDIKDMYCPITHQIFLNPVIAADGFTYEEDAIEEWLKKSCLSPMLGTKMSKKTYIQNTVMRNMVKYVLNKNKELEEEQYERIYTFNNIIDEIKGCQEINIEEIKEIVDYNACNNGDFRTFITNENIHKMTKKIKKSEFAMINGGCRLIDFYLSYCKDEELIKYVLDCTPELDKEINGITILRYASQYQTPKIIRMILEKCDNYDVFKIVKDTNIFYKLCIKRDTHEIIKDILSKNNNNELLKANDVYVEKGSKYIHAVCAYGISETIDILIKGGLLLVT